jgi:hypothetical protein
LEEEGHLERGEVVEVIHNYGRGGDKFFGEAAIPAQVVEGLRLGIAGVEKLQFFEPSLIVSIEESQFRKVRDAGGFADALELVRGNEGTFQLVQKGSQ